MSLVVIHRGGWDYYQREVTAGLEAYFGGREEPGRWLGSGAEAAELVGEVAGPELGLLFDGGCHPASGEPLGRPYGEDDTKAVTGFGVTFSPPKSVSVLWGLGDDHVGREARAAHDAAVAAALSFLEQHAALSRRGRGGLFQVDTHGFVAAAFVHRTSRTADPQLHTHVLVAAKVHGVDDRWRSLDGRELFGFKKAAGGVYQAALRAELTARLGVKWEPVDRHGQADVLGVPAGLLDLFSQRRRQVTTVAERRIAQWEDRLGRRLTEKERARQFQFAAYETRPAKGDGIDEEGSLRVRWRSQAAAWGHPVESWLAATVGRRGASATVNERAAAREVVAELEVSLSTWSRADAAVAVARRLAAMPGGARAVGSAMERLCAAVLADREVVRLSVPPGAEIPIGLCRVDGDATFERHGARRYSTRHTLALEGRVLAAVRRGRGASAGIAPEPLVTAAAADLDGDQISALWRLCRGGQRVACLVGPAGTGKTRTVAAAVEAWQGAGIPVRGLAVSAAAAEVLAAETGVAADTVARLLYEYDRASTECRLQPREVVLVDEAGLAPTYQLAALCELVEEAGGKLVLVGDPAQIGPVDAGGLLRLIAADRAVTFELGVARRFVERWEADASLQLRRQAAGAVALYDAHGRVRGGQRDRILDAAIAGWAKGRAQGATVLLVASDRATVGELVGRARALRVTACEVKADGIAIDDAVVGVGDEILTCRNNRQLQTSGGRWVRNGDRWVVRIQHRDGALTVASLSGKGDIRLPSDYVAEHVTLAYAVTAHRAQGVTVDRAIAVIDACSTAEQLYVAMTRGRQANDALVVCDPVEHHRSFPGPVEVLEAVLARSGIRFSATEALRQVAAAADDLAVLHQLLHQAQRHIERHAGPDRSAEVDQYRVSAEAYDEAQIEANAAAHHLDGLRLRWVDAVEQVQGGRRELARLEESAQRRHWWRRSEEVDLAPKIARIGQLDAQVSDLDKQIERTVTRQRRAENDQKRLAPLYAKHQQASAAVQARRRWVDSHPVDVAWADDLARRITQRTEQLGVEAVERSSRHLTELIGPPPANPELRPWWQALAAHLEAYRERFRIAPEQLRTHHPCPGVQAKLCEELVEAVHQFRFATWPARPARDDSHRRNVAPNRNTLSRDHGRDLGR